MPAIHLQSFADAESLRRQVCARLIAECTANRSTPFAVMLSGGTTPLPIYEMVRSSPVTVAANLSIMYSDERLVLPESPDSNYGNSRPLLQALRIPDDRVIRVRSELGLTAARERYEADINRFLAVGGTIVFGLLGMGADGHTASLFTLADARRSENFTLSVPGHGRHDRVSVSKRLLAAVESLVILVMGTGKTEITKKLLQSPAELPTGAALADHDNVLVWTDIPADRLR